MKKSTLLEKAKEHLALNRDEWGFTAGLKERFICFAVDKVPKNASDFRVAKKIKRDIESSLGGKFVYEQWLEGNGVAVPFNLPENFKKLQLSRLAWMDAMIAYYKSRGE